MLEIPLLDTENYTGKKTEEERKRLLNIIETHSPQSWASFNILGEFDFSDEKFQDTTGVLPPKCRSKSSPKIGRRQIDPPFHREVRRLQVVEIVVKNFSIMGCDQGATTPSYWAGRLA